MLLAWCIYMFIIGCSTSILHPSIGSYLQDVDQVYIPERKIRMVTNFKLPCAKDVVNSKQFASWMSMIEGATSWLVSTNGTNSTISNQTINIHLETLTDLSANVKDLSTLYDNLMMGKPGLNTLENFSKICESEQADDPSINQLLRTIHMKSNAIMTALKAKNHVQSKPLIDPSIGSQSPFPSTSTTRPSPATDVTCPHSGEITASDDRVFYLLTATTFGPENNVSFGHINPCDAMWDILFLERNRNLNMLTLEALKNSIGLLGYDEVESNTLHRRDADWDDDFTNVPNTLYSEWNAGSKHARHVRDVESIKTGSLIEVISKRICMVDGNDYTSILVDGRNYTTIMNEPKTQSRSPLQPVRKIDSMKDLTKYRRVASRYNKVISVISQLSTKVSDSTYNSQEEHLRLFACAVTDFNADPYTDVVTNRNCQVFVLKDDTKVNSITSSFCTDIVQSDMHINKMGDDCDVETMMKGNCGQTLIDNNLGIRGKRFLGDLIMKHLWKPMFGSASTHDLAAIKLTINQMIDNQKSIVNSTNANTRYIKSLGGTVSALTVSINKTNKELTKWSKLINTELSTLSETITKVSEQVKYNTLILHTDAIIQYISQATANLRVTLTQLAQVYHDVTDMFVRQVLSPYLFSHNMLLDVYNELAAGDDVYTLPPTWTSNDMFKTTVALAIIDDKNVKVMFEIPLVNGNFALKQKTYSIHSMPIFLGKWVRYIPKYKYIITQRRGANDPVVYNQISDLKYEQCKGRVASTCDMTGTWTELHNDDCISSLLGGDGYKTPESVCGMTVIPTNQVAPEAEWLSRNQWIVHPGRTNINMLEHCETSGTKVVNNEIQRGLPTDAIHRSLTINATSILEIPDGCTARFASILLAPTAYSVIQSQLPLDLNLLSQQYENRSADQVFIIDISTTLQSSLSYLGVRVLDEGLMSNITFDDKTLTEIHTQLTALIKSAENNTLTLPNTILKINDIEGVWSQLKLLMLSIPMWIWGVIIVSFVMVCFCCSRQLMKILCKPKIAMPAVAFSRVRGYDAAEINITQVKELNTTSWFSDEQLKAISDMMSAEITMFVVMLLTMVIFMYLHHRLLKNAIQKIIQSTFNASGWYPKNKSVTHHVGEVPVTVLVIVQTKRLFGPNVSHSIGLQICTLPGLSSDWYLKAQVDNWNLIKPVECRRFFNRFIMMFDWTKMCLLSHRYPNLDTCQDMPPIFTCPVSDISDANSHVIPWDWVSISVKGLVSLNVGIGSNSVNLYTYQ